MKLDMLRIFLVAWEEALPLSLSDPYRKPYGWWLKSSRCKPSYSLVGNEDHTDSAMKRDEKLTGPST
jgi:hypothetical protein